ncbi:MAG: hypothetical protein K2O41_07040 [Clostridia bacterium]|nr:hypothetical protein [Clostridia bacterium]MDE7182759.1 hypothetical protein [Clostridia bacterium]
MKKGCPYCKWSWEAECEICTLTDKPTNDAMECDFGYDKECAEYLKKNGSGKKNSRRNFKK